MGENLFTAYNYLSSAIAQAFAALIALTAMFYIYRINTLQTRIQKLEEDIRKIMENFLLKQEWKASDNFSVEMTTLMPNENLERIYQSRVDERRRKMETQERTLEDTMAVIKDDLRIIKQRQIAIFKTFLKKLRLSLVTPMGLSAFAMAVSIICLACGTLIPWDWLRGVVMELETSLALIALAFTVDTVEAMLGEPKEPEAEEK